MDSIELEIKASAMTSKEVAQRAFDLMKKIPRNKKGNPLTLEGVIQAVILKNPSMCPYRNHALSIIYCVLGSGIGWDEDGRLGDRTPNNYMNMPPEAGGQGCWSRNFGLDESVRKMGLPKAIIATIKARHHKEMIAVKATVLDIERRCQIVDLVSAQHWYPISWYGCNLAAPGNAKEDFLLGAIETATLILKASPAMGTKTWLTHQRTKEYANEILMGLTAIEKRRQKT